MLGSNSGDFYLRDACSHDIEDIFKLGALLNTINLPANRSELEHVIALSERSFAQEEDDPAERSFLFALAHHNKVIGVSQIRAQHGTLERPHSYFQVCVDERYSPTLHKYFRHQTLKLCQNFAGPTEIGSLVLAKEYRSHQASLGKQLSFVRFLFMTMKRKFFRDDVIAELMPPLGHNFASALWDALGYKFTGLDYATADMLSRKNKEFIKSLFPAGDIYLSLLPSAAQEIIGQVAPESQGAAHLLSSIGFRYNMRVDPFDGGPHFEAKLEDISLIKKACNGHFSTLLGPQEAFLRGLIGYYSPECASGERFRAFCGLYYHSPCDNSLSIDEQSFKALDLDKNTLLYAISLV